jgi:hypothetical protein
MKILAGDCSHPSQSREITEAKITIYNEEKSTTATGKITAKRLPRKIRQQYFKNIRPTNKTGSSTRPLSDGKEYTVRTLSNRIVRPG